MWAVQAKCLITARSCRQAVMGRGGSCWTDSQLRDCVMRRAWVPESPPPGGVATRAVPSCTGGTCCGRARADRKKPETVGAGWSSGSGVCTGTPARRVPPFHADRLDGFASDHLDQLLLVGRTGSTACTCRRRRRRAEPGTDQAAAAAAPGSGSGSGSSRTRSRKPQAYTKTTSMRPQQHQCIHSRGCFRWRPLLLTVAAGPFTG